MQEEVWKDIPEYEGCYQVSNQGNVRSLDRLVMMKGKYKFIKKGKLMSPHINGRGYLSTVLSVNSKRETFTIHRLVALAFFNHRYDKSLGLVIDHIDGNKFNNNIKNIQIITQRDNTIKSLDKKNKTSKYIGVSKYIKHSNIRWRGSIWKNGKQFFTKSYIEEDEAYKALINLKLNLKIK